MKPKKQEPLKQRKNGMKLLLKTSIVLLIIDLSISNNTRKNSLITKVFILAYLFAHDFSRLFK